MYQPESKKQNKKKTIQNLQDSFAKITGVSALFLDKDNKEATKISNPNRFGELMSHTVEGRKLRKRILNQLTGESRKAKTPTVNVYRDAGMLLVAIPILIGQEYHGSIILGPMRSEGESQMESFAHNVGVLSTALLSAKEALPEFDDDELEMMIELSKAVTDAIAQESREQTQNAYAAVESRTRELKVPALPLSGIGSRTDVGVYVCDKSTGEILFANQHFAKLVKQPLEQIMGSTCEKILPYCHHMINQEYCSHCIKKRTNNTSMNFLEPYQWEEYDPVLGRQMRYNCQYINWVDGRLAVMTILNDSTREHQIKTQLQKLAFTHTITGLPNRKKLELELKESQENMETAQRLICFEIGNLSSYRYINGTKAAHALLQEVACWAEERDFAPLYHFSNDIFCLRIKQGTLGECKAMVDEIREKFSKEWEFEVEGKVKMFYSQLNILLLDLDIQYEDEEESVFDIIDLTMELARKNKQFMHCNTELKQQLLKRGELEDHLLHCIKQNMTGFTVQYQPIVEPASGRWIGLEALCRWCSPKLGPVSPGIFIEMAEQKGVIDEIGEWVLKEAIRACKELYLDKQDVFHLSVNVSPLQLKDDTFAEKIIHILGEEHYPGNKLGLEITESAEMIFDQKTKNILHKLHGFGIQFALDDFGTGYSSFENLKELPINVLKTERKFICNVEESSYMRYFFYTIAELAHAAGMKLLAEGIENRKELDIVLSNGADFVQGYLFGKPLSREELKSNLYNFNHVYLGNESEIFDHDILFAGIDLYRSSPELFKIQSECIHYLLSEPSMEEAMEQVIEVIGKRLNLSRVHLYLKKEDMVFVNTHEWCAKGVEPMKERYPDIDLNGADYEKMPFFQKEMVLVVPNLDYMPRDFGDIMQVSDLRAMLVLPIWQDGMQGFLGLDNLEVRDWHPGEIMMLQSLAMVIGIQLKEKKRACMSI